MHAPKRETFDVAAATNTDPKGFVRPVERYAVHPWGLYMDRPADHPQFRRLESWLLPSLSLRASIFHFTPGHERDQDRYVDVVEVTREGEVWRTRDLYLDLVVRTGAGTELLDTDELLAAAAEGLLDPGTAEMAVRTAVTAVDGIAAHGHDLDAWLAALDLPISWASNP